MTGGGGGAVPPVRAGLGRPQNWIGVACDELVRATKVVLGVCVGAIVLITLAAVWWRYVLNAPLSWTEQVSRILFVWVTFLGAAVLYREKLHVAIDMFILLLPRPLLHAAFWTIEVAVLLFNVILFIYGLKLSVDTLSQTFGALDISPATFYFAAPVAAAMMILFFLERLATPSRRLTAESVGVSTSV